MSKNDIEELERGLAFAEEGRRRWREKALAARRERDDLQRRLDAVLEKLDNPYWVGLPYEPTIGAVKQIAAQCRAIAEGWEP